ncbi:MAG TPA: Ig-like domain-containing protein [Gemmatimonadaceae bacterium]|nr:Ig-like domain-containing protein [Gemmatimonadaceae bacterium]
MRSIVSTLATCATVAAMIACESNGPANPTLQFARVSFSQRAVDVGVNEQEQLTLSTTEPGSSVTWQTADPTIATVTSSGVVSGRRIGSTMVIAAAKKSSDTATIVVHTPITSLSFPYDLTTLSLGKSAQLTFTAYDKSGKLVQFAPSSARWTSLSPGIVSVSSAGVAQGLSLGTATIRIDMNGKTASTQVQVVQVPIASITVTPTPTTLNVGGKKQLQAVVKDSAGNILTNRTVNWTSSDTAVADVTGTGAVTATGTGQATITASSEGQAATASVTTNPAVVVSVGVALNFANIQVGQTTQAVATARDSAGNSISGRAVTWSTSNPAVAIVSSQGLVTALGIGSSSIKATIDGVTGSASLTVSTATVSAVSVTLGSSSIVAGGTTQATAVASDALGNAITGRSVTWSTSNSAVATVSNLGLVTAVAGGTVSVTATVDGVQGSATLVVTAPSVASVTVTVGSASLTAGQTTQASAVAKDASGNVMNLAVTWSSDAPTVASVSSSGLVSALSSGNANIVATVSGKTGTGAVSVQSSNTTSSGGTSGSGTLATLPQVFLTTDVASTPSAGRTLRVAAGGSLQAALDSAVPGDRILVAAGARFNGNFVIRPKTGGIANGWITVQSDGTIPGEGVRAGPTSAAAFPKLVSTTVLPALSTAGPAARWRFIGLEFTNDPALTTVNGTVYLGASDAAQSSLSQVPTDLIFDRVYIHGQTGTDDRKCLTFNGARLAVVDSYISECHSAFDAQAVTATNGPGPLKIVNNYLEASGENIAFGGADPGIANLVPADIEIRHNHFYKPLAWRGKWLAKNLLELKVGRRVLIDGNVMENSWPDGQAGYAFVLWSVNQQGGCTACVTEHVTVQNNIIKNASSAFQLSGKYDQTLSPVMNHLTIRNNVMIGIDNSTVFSGTSRVFQMGGDAIPQLTIEHNTGFGPDATFVWDGTVTYSDLTIRNNLTGGGSYQIFTPYGTGSAAWSRVAGSNSSFAGNIVALASDWFNVIPGNGYPQSMDAIGLAGGGTVAYSLSATVSQLMLSSSSPYKGQATDGTDPGANISAVLTATSGVVIP